MYSHTAFNLSQKTIDKLYDLSENDRYDFFINNIREDKELSEDQEELLEQISFLMMHEFNIDPKELNKIKFFLKLGYYTQSNHLNLGTK